MKNIEEVVVHKEKIYNGNYLALERWEVALPDNRHAMRDIVIPRDAVAILALDRENEVHFIRHSRPAVHETLIEIPAGIIEPGEAPEEAARRELQEEIGIWAGKLKKLVSYYHAEGYSTGVITVFLATELKVNPDFQPDQEEFLEQIKVPFETALEWLKQEKFRDSKTIMGLLFTASELNLSLKFQNE